MSAKVTSKVEAKLFLAKYKLDEISHIKILNPSTCLECKDKPCIICCPADVYEWEEKKLIVSYDNCVECGTCRIVCPFDNIDLKFPRWGKGIGYRYG